jgi:hypothetical protein
VPVDTAGLLRQRFSTLEIHRPRSGHSRSTRYVALMMWVLLLPGCQSRAGADSIPVLQPEEFGAVGDGLSDDTDAMQKAITAAYGGVLELDSNRVYLISRGLLIQGLIHIRGGGVLQAAEDIEARIGIRGGDSLIRFAEGANGSSINGLTIDIGGSGRNAVDVKASDMLIQNLIVRNYHKDLKSDGRRHRGSESGLRIRGAGSVVNGMHCENMTTGVQDAVPRCITVQGGARNIELKNISGKNITGGIVVGRSYNLKIDGYDFREFSDNGIYLLPGAVDTIVTNGYLENGKEPIVFKQDQRTRVSRLRIHNMRMSFGLENTSNVILEDVEISYDEELTSSPAFVRSRPKNTMTSNIKIHRINASMPFGDSLFSLGFGALENVEIRDSNFLLNVGANSGEGLRLVRQRRGQPIRLVNTTVTLEGPGEADVERAVIFVPPDSQPRLDRICENCRVESASKAIELKIRSRKP